MTAFVEPLTHAVFWYRCGLLVISSGVLLLLILRFSKDMPKTRQPGKQSDDPTHGGTEKVFSDDGAVEPEKHL